MNFFDTIGGKKFVEHTIPQLSRNVEQLCGVVRELTNEIVKLNGRIDELEKENRQLRDEFGFSLNEEEMDER